MYAVSKRVAPESGVVQDGIFDAIVVHLLEATESGIDLSMEGEVGVKVMANERFDAVPHLFDLVEIRGVRGQGQQETAEGLEQRFKLGLAMKRSVVEDDRLAGAEFGDEHLSKPDLDQQAVAVAGEGHGGKDMAQAPSGDHRHPLGGVA